MVLGPKILKNPRIYLPGVLSVVIDAHGNVTQPGLTDEGLLDSESDEKSDEEPKEEKVYNEVDVKYNPDKMKGYFYSQTHQLNFAGHFSLKCGNI